MVVWWCGGARDGDAVVMVVAAVKWRRCRGEVEALHIGHSYSIGARRCCAAASPGATADDLVGCLYLSFMVKRRSGDDTEHGGDAFSAADADANEAGADDIEADGIRISAKDGLVTAIETIATAAARLDAVNEKHDAVGGGD